ncbi:hypothetical protein L107_07358 [Cyanobium sp. Copco_Reservoir_LC18]|uniref:hypothetical protein n=1 Tax=Cyanobium sp. Copco_Reservoir_LC18 TaxID=1328305 RepID=UPI001358316C|nr:hypothetical protein [Cyanobium sp. Copco_Reservoir_LC18]KAF0653391.1 hypothetical protein L107_07358 [Cyanobium sp. Copco_Reservoir_LC18]
MVSYSRFFPWLATTVAFLAGAVVASGVAVAQQPNMQNALNALFNARSSLQMATPNKGGHRDQAITLVNQAIAEVEAGIAYAGN